MVKNIFYSKHLVLVSGLLIAIALTACGDDDNSIASTTTIPTAPDNILDLNTFAVNDNDFFRYRVQYQDGVRTTQSTSYDPIYATKFVETAIEDYVPDFMPVEVYGDNFYSMVTQSMRQQDKNTLTYSLQDAVSNRTVEYQIEYVPISLAGMNKTDTNSYSGIEFTTPLAQMANVPESVVFPEGSACYAMKTTSDAPVFVKYAMGMPQQPIDYQRWLTTEYSRTENMTYRFLQTQPVASNNELEAVSKVYEKQDGQQYFESVVSLNEDQAYNVIYQPEGEKVLGSTSQYDSVCTFFNDVATDFLNEQAKTYYPAQS